MRTLTSPYLTLPPCVYSVTPGCELFLEDAVGAAALLWLAPRCKHAFTALQPPVSDETRLGPRELIQLIIALALRYQFSGYIAGGIGQLLSSIAPGFLAARATGTMVGHLAWVGMALQLLGQRLSFFAPHSKWISFNWREPWLRYSYI